jgi:hypothetical protein
MRCAKISSSAKLVAVIPLYDATSRKSIARGATEMNNYEIREAMKANRLYNYEVAAALGVSEFTLSRKLRNELDQEEKEKILGIIEKLVKGAK